MKAFLIFEFRFARAIKPAFPVACFVFSGPTPHQPPLANSFSPSFALQKPAKDLLQMGSLAPRQLPLQDGLLSPAFTPQAPDAGCNIFPSRKRGRDGWDLQDIFHVDATCLSSKDWSDKVLSCSEEHGRTVFQAWRGKF